MTSTLIQPAATVRVGAATWRLHDGTDPVNGIVTGDIGAGGTSAIELIAAQAAAAGWHVVHAATHPHAAAGQGVHRVTDPNIAADLVADLIDVRESWLAVHAARPSAFTRPGFCVDTSCVCENRTPPPLLVCLDYPGPRVVDHRWRYLIRQARNANTTVVVRTTTPYIAEFGDRDTHAALTQQVLAMRTRACGAALAVRVLAGLCLPPGVPPHLRGAMHLRDEDGRLDVITQLPVGHAWMIHPELADAGRLPLADVITSTTSTYTPDQGVVYAHTR